MKITTESGTTYTIRNGICRRRGSDGCESVFKVWVLKALDRDTITTWDEVRDAPSYATPVVGKAIYIAGRDEFWLSTNIVSIEEAEQDEDE